MHFAVKSHSLKLSFLLCGFLWLFAPVRAQSPAMRPQEYQYLESVYLHLHQNPELSFYEAATGKYLANELRQLGFTVTEAVGGHGVVGVFRNGPGPTILVRTDTDALPVKEESGKAYASTVTTTDEAGNTVGVMHACGHDMHMTVWTGAARALIARKKDWQGTLVFIAQPAEERASGAKAMLADGLFTRFPVPDYGLALHVKADMPAGTIGYCREYAMASVDMVDITVFGRGGHGAYPHTTIDPVVLASRIVLDFQTIVSREISPLEPAVVTVGSIHGGTKGNIIGNEVKMELTLRSYSEEVRQAILQKLARICRGAAMSAGLPEELYPEIYVREEHTPSLYNDPELCERLDPVFRQALGEEKVKILSPVMGGEDFAMYGRTEEDIPILLFWLGTIEEERAAAAARGEIQLPSLHSSKFAPLPSPTIESGVKAMTAAVLHLLEK